MSNTGEPNPPGIEEFHAFGPTIILRSEIPMDEGTRSRIERYLNRKMRGGCLVLERGLELVWTLQHGWIRQAESVRCLKEEISLLKYQNKLLRRDHVMGLPLICSKCSEEIKQDA